MNRHRFSAFLSVFCFGFFIAILWIAPRLLAQNALHASPANATAPVAAFTVTAPATPIAVIPFELYHNRVYLPVRVNGSGPYTMILDTGAAETFVSEKVADEVKLQRKGSAQVRGNGEGVEHFPLAKNVNFSAGEATLLEKIVVVYDYSDLEKHEGRAIDGTLGVNFFHRYVVEIDYEKRKLLMFEPSTFVITGHGVPVPLQLLAGGTVALFDAKIVGADGQAAMEAHLAVDCGTYSALRLFRPFVEKHALIGEGRGQFASFGFGAGGEFQQVTGRVAGLEIDGVKIVNPVADFSTDTKGATATAGYDGTIGGDILRRFTVTLDYSRARMMLQPNASFGTPFETDKSGERAGAG